ncbi:hypothetical protein CEXT_814731 [Caerostris extrusa]|uniref:Uncharacterized protein n=1 Tax=Caerostris extrusa TaxID=172846 RepID=A0AAV4S0C8_CAEEX|nr:hypothetical protein CEXT_814731 [Caerostris extrusa]
MSIRVQVLINCVITNKNEHIMHMNKSEFKWTMQGIFASKSPSSKFCIRNCFSLYILPALSEQSIPPLCPGATADLHGCQPKRRRLPAAALAAK